MFLVFFCFSFFLRTLSCAAKVIYYCKHGNVSITDKPVLCRLVSDLPDLLENLGMAN